MRKKDFLVELLRPTELQESRFKKIQQLSLKGENAEAYFSSDGKRLIFQARSTELEGVCDQIYTMTVTGRDVRMVSTGNGRTTCSYFLDGDRRILYASTHLAGDDCPEIPPHEGHRYVWPIFDSYDIFSARPDGSGLRRLTDSDGYDAEATVSPDGSLVVFTSNRDGDLELYTMKPDGTEQTRITDVPGYDGGAFFSPDGTKLCFRASRPKSNADLKHYRDLLAQQLVEPTQMEIYVVNVDGSDLRQVTNNGRANFCPYFHPSGEKLIFASNFHSPRRGRPNFDLFLIGLDGKGIERVTFHESFDGFPMFSPDGTKLVWCSNRFAAKEGDTNIFLADWAENPTLGNP
jgi:Tol biopolymer transport system component